MAIPKAPTNKKTNKEKMDEYISSTGRTPVGTPISQATPANGGTGNAPSSPNVNKPANVDKIQAVTGVVPVAPMPTAPTTWNEITELAKPTVVPSGPSGEVVGWKDITVTPSTPAVGSSAQNTLPVSPPKGVVAFGNADTSTGTTNTDNTSEGDTDAEKKDPDDEEKDPIDTSAMLQGIIDSAFSSDNAATDKALEEYFNMLGGGKAMAAQYAGWMDEALKGAGAINTDNAMWGTAEDIIAGNVERGDDFAATLNDILNSAGIASTYNPMIGTTENVINNALGNIAAQDRRIADAIANTPMAGSDWDDKMLAEVQNLIEFNKGKSDAYSNNIYGNVDWLKNTGTDLMDYMKGYNPLDTDWGRGVLDYYGIQSVDASNNANAAGAADNGGNIDSYAAANAERQRLSTLGQGINAISGMTNDRFSNLLNTFNSIGVNVNNLLGLEGQYNLPFANSQLSTISTLAKDLYNRDADAVNEYNTAINNFLGQGNSNIANYGTLGTIAGTLAKGLAEQNVNAMNNYYDFNKEIAGIYGENLLPFFDNQAAKATEAANTMSGNALTADKQSKDHLENVLNQGGANLLPFIQGITDTAGTVSNNLYGTDANSTIALYNLINGVYGNGTSTGDLSETVKEILPSYQELNNYISAVMDAEGLTEISEEDVPTIVAAMVEAMPELANKTPYLSWLVKDRVPKTENKK